MRKEKVVLLLLFGLLLLLAVLLLRHPRVDQLGTVLHDLKQIRLDESWDYHGS